MTSQRSQTQNEHMTQPTEGPHVQHVSLGDRSVFTFLMSIFLLPFSNKLQEETSKPQPYKLTEIF